MPVYRIVMSLGVIMTPITVLFAQQTAQEGRGLQESAAAERGSQIAPGSLDSYLVSCLITGNKGEIALSQIAEQRASSPQVKTFAEQMVKEHSDMLSKVQSLGGAAKTQNRSTSSTQAGQAEQAHAGQATIDQLMQIKDQVAQQCLEMAKRELNQLEGTEFDKAYMGMQVGAHHQMAAQLTVFKLHASPALQSVVAKGLEATEQHLENAKRLCKQLDTPKGTPQTARRNSRISE